MNSLVDSLRRTAERFPDRRAIHHAGADWTYADLEHHALAIAGWLLEGGLRRGDRVALLLPNSVEYVAAYYGTLIAGGCVVALNPESTQREIEFALTHSGAVAAVAGPVTMGKLQTSGAAGGLTQLLGTRPFDTTARGAELAKLWSTREDSWPTSLPAEDDLAQIIYTSGTTSHPKGVALSHRNLAANTASIVQYLSLTADDSIFVILPLFYSYGNSLLLTHVHVGGTLVMASDFVFWNRALDLMERERATGFAGVPSSYAMILERSDFDSRKFSDLRYLTCAGGGLPPATAARLRSLVPHAELFLMYGQTEAAARLSTLMPADLDRKLGSIGRAIPGVELDLRDDGGNSPPLGETGEIAARGDNVMTGYWNDPEVTGRVLRDGWLYTGDLARRDEDGFFWIVGRKGDMIKSGAYRISPEEIEEVLAGLEGVSEVAVVGRPDEVFGEVPVAFVVLAESSDVSSETILKEAQSRLPRHKWIRAVQVIDALPRTASGKVRRGALRAQLGESSG